MHPNRINCLEQKWYIPEDGCAIRASGYELQSIKPENHCVHTISVVIYLADE